MTAVEDQDVESLIYVPGVYRATITPEVAKRLLERNIGNRPQKKRAQDDYAEAMRRGQWRVTNQGLGFDNDGILIDGQNRLWACVKAETPFETLIATGLEPVAKDVVDVGVKRSFADVLRMEGKPSNATVVASAVRLRMQHETLSRWGRPFTAAATSGLSHSDLLAYLLDHPQIERRATLAWVDRKVFVKLPTSSALAFESLLGEYAESEGDDAELAEFRDAWLTGAMLPEGDARLALRNYLTKMDGFRSINSMHTLGIMIKAWNDWKVGESRAFMTLRDNEPMPKFNAQPNPKALSRRRRDRARKASA